MSDQKKPKKLLVAGGGTGGHVLAGIAIADEWRQEFPNSKIMFVGSEQGLESRLVPKHGYPLVKLKIGALNRVSLKTRLLTMFKLPFSFLKALWVLIKFRPNAVIGVGGYASGPVVMLARFLAPLFGIKTAILEQNSVAGFTNRMLGKWVHQVFCAFEDGASTFTRSKVVITGNPIRSHLKKLPPSKDKPFTLFIFGGSQGALGINTMIMDALPFLKKENVEFIHQTGVNDYERVKSAYEREGITGVRVEKFIDDMASCYEKSSLVICRAGASTLSELASVGRAAIFIPLPTAADNHQEKNARIFEKIGAAIVVPQGSLTGSQFAEKILSLKNDHQRIHSIEEKVRPFYRGDSAELIVKGLVRA
jgi:UDP-N-acetylglucosamine--N-acetylmuramyl-(pentapeptide) pyrophosphoryl-undecaprenol N-acetylglucosamine transferase